MQDPTWTASSIQKYQSMTGKKAASKPKEVQDRIDAIKNELKTYSAPNKAWVSNFVYSLDVKPFLSDRQKGVLTDVYNQVVLKK